MSDTARDRAPARRAGLVDAAWLAARLDDPGLRILDCTTYMTPQPVGPSRIDSGRPDWARAHIPGARHVDMVADLSDPQGAFPYTLPSPAHIDALRARLGITDAHHVVLYGARHPMVVTRAWWVLSTLGHPRVSILDGGWEAWRREGRPIETGLPESDEAGSVTTTDVTGTADAGPASGPASSAPSTAAAGVAEDAASGSPAGRAARDAGRVADADDVARALREGSAQLVNALSPEQFRGTGGAHYGRPGRIPGSLNLPARDLTDPATGTWRTNGEIEALAAAAGLAPDDAPVIVYCGGGIAATATAFALHLVGRRRVAVYDNSLLEWSADPARPIQLG
jgi:thiosulfate/3-mercaptopyruvate sulfurtransferase